MADVEAYLTAEAKRQARVEIDRQLAECGWLVQDRKTMNLYCAASTPARSSASTVWSGWSARSVNACRIPSAAHVLHIGGWTRLRIVKTARAHSLLRDDPVSGGRPLVHLSLQDGMFRVRALCVVRLEIVSPVPVVLVVRTKSCALRCHAVAMSDVERERGEMRRWATPRRARAVHTFWNMALHFSALGTRRL